MRTVVFASAATSQELLLKAVCFTTHVGCLTPLQVAQLLVHMFPYPAVINTWAQEIAMRWEEKQQQQQQQQGQQQHAVVTPASSGISKKQRRVGKRQW